MGILQKEILSRGDFDQAVVHLRLNTSEIAKETNIPRTYLSEFRNGDRKLRPEMLAKLRDFFEAKGIEFDQPPKDDQASPLSTVKEIRHIWPVGEAVSDENLQRAQALIEANDAKMAERFKLAATRNDGLFGDGERTKETLDAMREVIMRMAENYLVMRNLRGWPAFGLVATNSDLHTIRDELAGEFRPVLESLGLIEPEATEDGDQEFREAA